MMAVLLLWVPAALCVARRRRLYDAVSRAGAAALRPGHRPAARSLVGGVRYGQALQLASLLETALWPPDSDPATQAAKRQLRQNRWIPAFGEEPAPEPAALTAVARALDADLRRHCPDLTLADVRCLVLQQRLMVLERLVDRSAIAALGPAELALQQQVLIDCQLIMHIAGPE